MSKQANTVTDLVPASVLTKIAERVKNVALVIAASKGAGRVGKLNPFRIGAPTITKNQVAINLTLDLKIVPEAAAYEWGSGLHSDSPEFISIDARNAPFLVFEGTNGYPVGNPGGLIKVEHVNHPGVKARPYIKPAKEATRQQNLADIRAAVNKNIRLIIVANSSKGKSVTEQPY